MKHITKANLKDVKKMRYGEIGDFTFVDCGRVFCERFMAIDGEMFFETESCYRDIETGKDLECFSNYDDEGNHLIAVKELDGSIEIQYE